MLAKVLGVAVAAFGTVAICNHANVPKGLPLAGVLVLIFLVGLTFLAKRTSFGRHVYAVGGNAEAARRAGINVPRIRILVFMISGAMAGVGGIILAANVNSVDLNVGGGTLLLNAIAAAVIGGVSLFGGRGEVRGALLGSLVIATVSNGLLTAGYKNGIIYVVTGTILLLAVTLDTVARGSRSARAADLHAEPLTSSRVYRFYRGGALIGRLRGELEEDGETPEDWIGSVTPAHNPGRDDPLEGLTRLADGRLLRDVVAADPATCARRRRTLRGTARRRGFWSSSSTPRSGCRCTHIPIARSRKRCSDRRSGRRRRGSSSGPGVSRRRSGSACARRSRRRTIFG